MWMNTWQLTRKHQPRADRCPKKEMVPSDLIPSLARHRHARYRASQSGVPDVSSFGSPITVFSGYRINASRLAATLSRSGPDARNGLSLAHNSYPFQDHHSRVNIPGLLL